ncbi:hypothetical protein [Micromonospora craniellae]|uniref:hypothetical protein n=1 Tax=Micromonospora craniellae TaxID=2294034 RepID=UPI001313EAF3|nr:hypothetical protein [Micromonospora craniellae]QOC93988.1 hypothetical protein ID554_10430 [Micromonospora craniellae]
MPSTPVASPSQGDARWCPGQINASSPFAVLVTYRRPGGGTAVDSVSPSLLRTGLQHMDHPDWCDPSQCIPGSRVFDPAAPPPAHRGTLYTCSPLPGRQGPTVAAQLVRFVEDPDGVLFARLLVGDGVDGSDSYYLPVRQAEELTTALVKILRTARS